MRILAVIFAILLVLAGVVYFSFNGFVKRAIEHAATQATGTQVRIGSFSVAPTSGNASISNLRIYNPEGFSNKPMIAFGEIKIELDPASLFSDLIDIQLIEITEPFVAMEMNENGNNLRLFQNSLQNSKGSTAAKDETVKKVKIALLRIIDGQVSTHLAGQDLAEVGISDLELKNLGSGRGINLTEAFTIVLEAFMRDAVRASTKLSIKSSVDNILNRAGETGEKVQRSIRGLFE